jgi:hypothetical protein
MFKCLDTLLLISSNSQKLEQLQLEAARIVTGLTIFSKAEILYRETGWELLSARRKRRKLQLFFNIVNKNTPNYLCTLIPLNFLAELK